MVGEQIEEGRNSRQARFPKRCAGILKKANELAILCDAEIAVIIFSSTGQFFEFSSSSMNQTLSRYIEAVDPSVTANVEEKAEVEEKTNCEETNDEALNLMHRAKDTLVLRQEIKKLKAKQRRLLGKDLHDVDAEELQQLEGELNEALFSINERKEQILIKQLEKSRTKAQRVALENEALRKQAEELQGVLPLTIRPQPTSQPMYLEYYPLSHDSLAKGATTSPDMEQNDGVENGDSETTLRLWPPSVTCGKRKKPEEEIHPGNSDSRSEPISTSLSLYLYPLQ